MADYKREALKRLAGMSDEAPVGKLAKGKMADRSMMDQILEYMAKPGAASRAAIAALQADQSPVEAFTSQWDKPSAEAPTGADIAETFGEQYGVENPYALGALATITDLGADPTNLVPGGAFKKLPAALGMAKGIKGMGKGQRGLSKVGDVEFPAASAAEALKIQQALKQTGKVPEGAILQIGERLPVQAREELVQKAGLARAKIPQEEMLDVMRQFPNLRKMKKYGGRE